MERFSGTGGTIFRLKRNLFRGREEGFSHHGGSKFRDRWKKNKGSFGLGGTIFRAKKGNLCRGEGKKRPLYVD